jgi:hypothetical protein
MSNLRLINETTATSVASISVTDVFTSDFDIYKIVIAPMDLNNNNDMELRFVNSSGSVISASNYDNAHLVLTAYASFPEGKQTNTTRITGVGRDEQQSGNGTVMYVFNPNSASSYSFVLHQDNGFVTGSGYVGYKGIGVLKQTASMTGYQIFPTSSTNDITATTRTYGLRVDS